MLGFNHLKFTRFLLPLVLVLLSALVVAAQDTHTLTPGETVTGGLDEDNLAQIYTFTGTADQIVSLAVNSEAGLQLVVILTDSAGQQLAQFLHDGTAASTTPDLTLPADGTYYVTVFALTSGAEDALTSGSFQLTLLTDEEAEVVEETATAGTPTDRQIYTEPGEILTTSGLEVVLTWSSVVDLNLQIRDPLGETLYWDSRTTSIGGSFGLDANGLCEVTTADAPTETAAYPAGSLPTGSYEVLVFYRQSCDNSTESVPFSLISTVDGQTLQAVQGSLLPPLVDQDSVFITSFEIAEDGSVTQGASGVYTLDTLPAPAEELQANALPIQDGVPVNGSILNDQVYETFSFEGTTDQFVSISMTAVAGSLDTLLILLSPDGTRLDFNDDRDFGITDSALLNLRLPVDGTYTVVATRYGKELGGTEGNYVLDYAVTEGAAVPQAVIDLALPQGSIEISLVWNTPADLQLLVRDPSGASVFDDITSIPSGGRLVQAGNVQCRISPTPVPLSYIYWPEGGARGGTYEVEVRYQNDCAQNAPVQFTLTIEVNGFVITSETATPVLNDLFVTNFTINTDGTVTPGEAGIVGGSTQVPYGDELATAPALESGQPVTGEITPGNTFDVYVFEGTAGDVVSIGMTATRGTLDTRLFLIDAFGVQVAENDDVVAGEDTNSAISNYTLTADGQYTVIATRYGLEFGGTLGSYSLVFSRINS